MNPIPNSNETENYVVIAIVGATSAWAAKHGVDSSSWTAIVTEAVVYGAGAAAAIASFVSNFNKKKVHEDATVVPPPSK